MKFYKSEFMSMTANGIEKREGYKFDYLLGDGTMTQLGVYKTDDKNWRVVDLECGLSLCIEPTRTAAVAMAERLRDKYMEIRETPKYKQDVEKFMAAMQPSEECTETVDESPIENAPAIQISLETMQEWCASRGNVIATQKREGCCIWVEGETKPYKEELKELGFRWGKARKAWYYTPVA